MAPGTAKKIRVIVVDDSAFVRKMLSDVLSSDPEIEVVATATDPYIARELIKKYNPDVITLDVEMPKMDGISFLEKIMTLRPMPVVMVSTLTQKNAEETLRALELGAVDYVGKPKGDTATLEALRDEIISKVKIASKARIRPLVKSSEQARPKPAANIKSKAHHIIAIGSSTGGVEALSRIIPNLPENFPPVLITQHMPPDFTAILAARLNKISAVKVHEAKDKQKIAPGNVYIAPGSQHMEIKLDRLGEGFVCSLNDSEKVSGHKPSVDVLFESFARNVGNRALGVILTGMGRDGAKGMLMMKQAGAYNIAQDEESCVVYGMPKAAYLAGAVDAQVPLEGVVGHMLERI